MGWLRKKAKQVGRAIKKVGKSIGKGFKKVFGKVAKAFGKLGPLGSIAMMVMMPYVPVFWTNLGTWASGLTTSANVLAKGFGYAMKGLYHAGNAAGKVYSSVTGAIKGALNFVPGGKGMGLGRPKVFLAISFALPKKLATLSPNPIPFPPGTKFKVFRF